MTTTITATPEPAATPPRVRLDITSDQTSVVPYRVAQDGSRTPVRTFSGGSLPISAGSALIYDPEARIGEEFTYTADGSGVTNSAPVTLSGTSVWLVHPGIPARSVAIRATGMGERSRDPNQAVRYPLGAKYPIVAHDGQRKAATYDLRLRTKTLAELDAIDALLDDCATVLLNVPVDLRWGVGAEYVAVGRLGQDRLMRWGGHPYRNWTLPCTVTARPAGGTQADNTYAKSFALYPTYAARYAAHATYRQAFDPTP